MLSALQYRHNLMAVTPAGTDPQTAQPAPKSADIETGTYSPDGHTAAKVPPAAPAGAPAGAGPIVAHDDAELCCDDAATGVPMMYPPQALGSNDGATGPIAQDVAQAMWRDQQATAPPAWKE